MLSVFLPSLLSSSVVCADAADVASNRIAATEMAFTGVLPDVPGRFSGLFSIRSYETSVSAARVEWAPFILSGPCLPGPCLALAAISRHRQECLLDSAGARRRDEFCRRGVGEHLATMEHDHAVGVRHLVAQVRRPQHRDAALRAHVEQLFEQ